MPFEFLYIVAEVAVAFAGFAGIVVVIASRRGDSPERTEINLALLRNVLGGSLMAIAFALVPAVLAIMGIAANSALRVSSGLYAITFGLYLIYVIIPVVSLYKTQIQSLPRLLRFNIILTYAIIGILTLCSIGVVPTQVYFPCLLVALYGAGTSFVRVFISIGSDL